MDGNGSASRIQFGSVTLIPDERVVLKDGRAVPLTPKAFDLLVVLTANPGRLLTKEHLMQAVWPNTTVEESNLAYHVFALRKAFGESSDSDGCIETVPKRGYRFVAAVQAEAGGRAVAPAQESQTPTVEARPRADLSPVGPVGRERPEAFPGRRRTGITLGVWLGIAGGLALIALMLPGLGLFGNQLCRRNPF